MGKKHSSVSFEEKKKKVEALTKKMQQRIDQHFHSPAQLKEYLSFMAQFYRYSPSNIALIQSHFPGAQAVGSFSFWKEKGFTVQKGEKGIPILVPQKSAPKFKDDDGKWKSIRTATKKQKQEIKDEKREVTEGRLYFTIGYTFDVSQTNATAQDLPQIFPNRWLEGNVPDYDSLYKGMEAIAEKNGISIVEPKEELGAAKGVSYTLLKEVALNPRNSELQNVKTLLHELAHAKLHTVETYMNYSDAEKEFQAEMTAYVVASHFGIDTSEYSLGYLATWTQGKELKEKTKLLKEVHETSVEFIETIESTLGKEKEQIHEKGEELMKEGAGPLNHVVTLEVLDKEVQNEEVAKIHMLDGVTNDTHMLSVWNGDPSNREDLYVSLTSKTGELENTYLDDIVTYELHQEIQQAIFDQEGNMSFVLHDKNTKMSLDEIVKDERYGKWVERDHQQLDPFTSEKEKELYQEMRKEGYAPIPSVEQEKQVLPHTDKQVTASMEKELSEKYEVFKRAQSKESLSDIDSIITRVKAEERYFATRHVSIDNELITQEAVTTLENGVREKLSKEGITVKNQDTSKNVEQGKQFEPIWSSSSSQQVAKKKNQEVELER